jgi:hypothetical protein
MRSVVQTISAVPEMIRSGIAKGETQVITVDFNAP